MHHAADFGAEPLCREAVPRRPCISRRGSFDVAEDGLRVDTAVIDPRLESVETLWKTSLDARRRQPFIAFVRRTCDNRKLRSVMSK